MKKTYSVILLFAFLVGTLQPILPMIEYQLFEGSVIELITSNQVITASGNYHFTNLDVDHQNDKPAPQENLLDTDYYPLALDMVTLPKPEAFFISARNYLPTVNNVNSPTFLPNPPPPRLS